MIERFTGEGGSDLAVEALRKQYVIGESIDLAKTIFDSAKVLGFERGSTIIEESAADNDIFFILAGTVSIRVSGREVAVRTFGQHIGEMALLDPGQSRSASAVAKDEVVIAQVSANEFIRLAESSPRIWRNIASELAVRLRQRNRFLSPMNSRPVVFLGCSSESLQIARAIQSALDHDPFVVRVWTDNTFGASSFPMESLERELPKIDFAALVLSPDDTVVSRNTESSAPRDNLVFELGLFMGALGRSRTFLVYPRDVDIKIPTDLVGITPVTYESILQLDVHVALASACNQMRDLIATIGPR